MKRFGRGLAFLAVSALAACAGGGPVLPPAPVHTNGQALWTLLHDRCVPAQVRGAGPAPCAVVSIADGEARGFVLLKDRVGASQYLLMPTAKITGVEDPVLLAPATPNYFALAWDQRHFVEDRLGRPLDRAQVSIAVNSIYGRSQDQLHLHIDCLDKAVGEALKTANPPRDGRWADHPIPLDGHAYHLRWLGPDALARTSPFQLLARTMPGARKAMGAWTLLLVGGVASDGSPGFYLLADRANPAAGDGASAEELQDHACRL